MSADLPSSDPVRLTYATPATSPSYTHKVWAGVAIAIVGLGIAIVGGCFLIGIMIITNNGFNASSKGLTPSANGLVVVLYVLATLAFSVAAWVLFKALAGLFRVLRA